MASSKQRKAKLRRAQHATRRKPSEPRLSDAASALAGMVTDDRLLGWARAEGLDLTDRVQLLDACAVGLSILLWRNTELENIHAGVELIADSDEDRKVLRDRLDTALDADLSEYDAVADPAERTRIALLLEQRCRAGVGIPDDVMMRTNASTARAVRAVLDEVLPAAATVPGAEMPYQAGALPEFLIAVAEELVDADRPLTVGSATVAAGQLLGERGWAAYERDVDEKLTRPLVLADAVGARRALWFSALTGATYGDGWWPSPHWAGAIADLRAALAAGDLERVTYQPERERPHPDPDDEEFWKALTAAPEQLNGAQAWWVINSRVRDRLYDRRRAAAAAAGAADAERFPTLIGLY